MTYFYYRENGTVAMKSETKIQTKLKYRKITPKPDEQEKIDRNYEMKMRNGNLVFKEPEHERKENLKDMLSNVQSVADVKLILNKLIR